MYSNDLPDRIEISPSKLSGTIRAPGSKSYTHRAIIAASLAEGISIIHNPIFCEDTEVTIKLCQSLGAQIVKNGSSLEIEGFAKSPLSPATIDFGESGTSLRLGMGLCAWLPSSTLLQTHKTSTLSTRSSADLIKSLESLGAVIDGDETLPLVIKGGIKGGEVEVSGKSSQYLSSLLMIGPLLEKGLEISVTDELKSKHYIEVTMDILKTAGIKVTASKDFKNFKVSPADYKKFEFSVPGDYSSIAPIMCSALSTWSEISVLGLVDDKQGDKKIIDILKDMGGIIKGKEEIKISPSELRGIELDGKDTPDIVPALAGLACMCSNESRFYNISHLKNKESDRISDLAMELKKTGAKVKETEDELKVSPGSQKHAFINPHDDHRIAMALSVVGLGGKGIKLLNPSVVYKSYPDFFRDLRSLGADIE